MEESKSVPAGSKAASSVVQPCSGDMRNSELEITKAGTQTGNRYADEHRPVVVNPALDRVKERTQRMSVEWAREQQRRLQYEHWLEHGSDNLRDAWVSLCPRGTSHDVTAWKLEDIVEIIRTGGQISVTCFQWDETTDLREAHRIITALYQRGVKSANNLNRITLARLLKEIGIDVGPDAVEYVVTQPKANEKKFFFREVVVAGKRHKCPEGFPYRPPEVLGKKQAGDAKKRVPCVTPAGLFLPERNSHYLVQATGLYPLDIDTVRKIEEAIRRIQSDAHVALVFISITGSGLCVCVRGPVSRTAAEYSKTYEAIAVAKSKEWGLEAKMDEDTKDISRLRFLSYDPALYVNWDAEVFPSVAGASKSTNPLAVAENAKTSNVDSEQTASDAGEYHQEEEPTKAKTTDSDEAKDGSTSAEDGPTDQGNGSLEIDWTEAGEVPKLDSHGIPLARCLDAMRYISSYDREPWRKVAAALKLGYGDEAFPFFDLWSSFGGDSYKDSEDCRKTWDSHTRQEGDNVFTPAGILWMAKQNGWAAYRKKGVFLPTKCASDFCCEVYRIIAPTDTLFLRGGQMVCIEQINRQPEIVAVDAAKGIRHFESHIQFLKQVKGEDGPRTVPVALTEQPAKLLVKAVQPGELREIRAITRCPPLVKCDDGQNLRIAEPGYIAEACVYNTSNLTVPVVPLDEAIKKYKWLYREFDFPTPGDRSRALAFPIGVALKMSGLIKGFAALDFGTANDQQSGKGTRQRMTAAFFAARMEILTQSDAHIGGTAEQFKSACLAGRTFLQFDNFDSLQCRELEAFLTGENVRMRDAFGRFGSIDPANHFVSLSSNGLASRRDLALRSWFIRIEKKPEGYVFHLYPEGSIVDHIYERWVEYLGCIYSFAFEWWKHNRPRTDETRHAFRDFTQSCDWIAQHILNEAPVMDGHDEAVSQYSDAGKVFFLRMWDVLSKQGKLNRVIRAGRLATAAFRWSIPIPGTRPSTPLDEKSGAKLIGAMAADLFEQSDSLDLGRGKIVERRQGYPSETDDQFEEEMKYMMPRRSEAPCYVFLRKDDREEKADIQDAVTQFRDALIEQLGPKPICCTVSTEEIAGCFKDCSVDQAGKWMSELAKRHPKRFISVRRSNWRGWRIDWR